MKWKKRENFSTIKEVVEKSTGMSIEELHRGGSSILHMDEAVKAVSDAIRKNEPVKIMGDYDCDGVLGGTILYMALERYIQMTGSTSKVSVRFPKRFSEGYGLSEKVVDETDSGMLLCVDNGIAAIDAIKKAKEKGLSVVMLDHHLAKAGIPAADVIVDPHVYAENGAFLDFCGAHLAYRFAQLLIPSETGLLDKLAVFAGIATVADVMPIVKDNWLIVRKSLELLDNGICTRGLAQLAAGMHIEVAVEDDYGYKIAPAINACGRLYDDGPQQAFEVLSEDRDLPELPEKAEKLIHINEERKALARELEKRADELLSKEIPKNCIVIYDEKFHLGINGIVAGYLTEQYHKPAIVFSPSDTENVMKGSGRTYGDINLKALLDETASCYLGYGGHAGAAGVAAKTEDLDKIRKALDKSLEGKVKPPSDELDYDLTITEQEVENSLDELDRFRPFGEGNPAPIFRLTNFILSPQQKGFYRLMGQEQEHMKLFGKDMDAILFGNASLFEGKGSPKTMEIVGKLSRNYFHGTARNQIEVLDLKETEKKHTDTYLSFADLLNFS